MAYWLMKSEPDAYSIDDLERDGREPWDGIRNYQARNMMRDDMKIGDEVFFYHSNCKEPGWCLVDVEFVRKLGRTITLAEIKEAKGLDGLILTRKGNRLSIMPIEKKHWDRLLRLE